MPQGGKKKKDGFKDNGRLVLSERGNTPQEPGWERRMFTEPEKLRFVGKGGRGERAARQAFRRPPDKGEPHRHAHRPQVFPVPITADVVLSAGGAQSRGEWVCVPSNTPPRSHPTPAGRPPARPECHAAVPSSKRTGSGFPEHLLWAQCPSRTSARGLTASHTNMPTSGNGLPSWDCPSLSRDALEGT